MEMIKIPSRYKLKKQEMKSNKMTGGVGALAAPEVLWGLLPSIEHPDSCS